MTATWQHEPEARRPLLRALRRRRELRAGLVQAVYTTVGLLLGLTLPGVDGGPTVEASAVTPLMLAVAGGFLPFIALVFSLLFLVVQYGNTTVSPRLTLFRDDPFLWHAFAFFVAVFVYASTAGVRLGNAAGHVTVAVPILAIALVFTALLLARALQLRALGLLQFPATMEQIRRRGEAVINALYATPTSTGPTVDPSDELPAVATPLRWTEPTVLMRQIDLPKLYAEAVRLDAVVQIDVMVGDELRRGATIGTIHARTAVDGATVMANLSTGTDRSFAQDPLLAFRLLSDIGDRALSPAINDPATAVQALGCVQDLLVLVMEKNSTSGWSPTNWIDPAWCCRYRPGRTTS